MNQGTMHVNTSGAYMEAFNEESMLAKSCVAIVKRPDGRCLTSAMLGVVNNRPFATLGQTFDLALATLELDGEVAIKFANQAGKL